MATTNHERFGKALAQHLDADRCGKSPGQADVVG